MQEIAYKHQLKFRLLMLAGSMAGLVGMASADVNWTNISNLVTDVATELFPAFITLIENAVPIIIVIAVVGFIVTFLDRILGMLKI